MKSILLVGGGGHCRASIDVLEKLPDIRIVGIVQSRDGGLEPVLGYPVLGTDDDLPVLLKTTPQALVTVGQIRTPDVRISLFEQLKRLGAELPTIVSPTACCSRHADVGRGSILMHCAVVNAKARIGENCIVNSQALIEHDSQVGSNCHISTGARVNGGVWIGEGSFVGSGAILREGVRIGARAVIGAGQIVLKDVPDGAIVRGADV